MIDLASISDEELLSMGKVGVMLLLMKHIREEDLNFFRRFYSEIVREYLKGSEEDLELVILYTLSATRRELREDLFEVIKEVGGEKMESIAQSLIEEGMEKGLKVSLKGIESLT